MPRLTPRVEFVRPDGSPGTYFIGATETIKAAEAGIVHALSEARAAGGTGLCISVIDPSNGRCVYRARVPQQEGR